MESQLCLVLGLGGGCFFGFWLGLGVQWALGDAQWWVRQQWYCLGKLGLERSLCEARAVLHVSIFSSVIDQVLWPVYWVLFPTADWVLPFNTWFLY